MGQSAREMISEEKVRPQEQRKPPKYYGVDPEAQPDEEVQSDTESEKEDTQECRIEKILSTRQGPKVKWEFKVQFMGYPPLEAIWLPGEYLNKKALIAAKRAPILAQRQE